MSSYGTSSPSASATRLCRTREPSFSRSSRKLTFLRETALYSLTGTLSSPKLIDPLQIALGIVLNHETVVGDQNHRSHQFPKLAPVPGYPGGCGTNLARAGTGLPRARS